MGGPRPGLYKTSQIFRNLHKLSRYSHENEKSAMGNQWPGLHHQGGWRQAGPGHPPGQACPGHPPGQACPYIYIYIYIYIIGH